MEQMHTTTLLCDNASVLFQRLSTITMTIIHARIRLFCICC